MKSDGFVQQVLRFSHEEHLWQKGDAILAAVSGGPDSLGLLFFLKEIAEREELRLGCCCVNHHLRQEAESEAAYVESIAKKLDIPFYLRHVYVEDTRKAEKGSVETVARNLRYAALREVKEEGHFQYIALAHHANDQAETVIFHFLRGSGLRGLSGMQPKRDDLIRPFLEMTKEEIRTFLASFSCPACHDASNDVPDTTRNQIRLQLMPQLLSYNPNVVDSLNHMADIFREEDGYMEAEARQWRKKQEISSKSGALVFDKKAVLSLPVALQRRVLRQMIEAVGEESPDFPSIERMRQLILAGKNHSQTSSQNVMLQLGRDSVFLFPGNTRAGSRLSSWEAAELTYKKECQKIVDNPSFIDIIDKNRKRVEKGPWQLTIETLSERPKRLMRNQYLLDADQVGDLGLVFPKAGDTMAPYGMEGTKEIARLLQEADIPQEARPIWPLLADENQIYWTGLVRGSRYGRPSESTTHFLCVTCSWIGEKD